MVEKQQQIIGITGYSAVGKSTLAQHLRRELGIGMFSLGNYQRAEFASHGKPEEYLIKLGVGATYYDKFPDYLAEIAKNMNKKGIVVESIYTHAFLSLMRDTFKINKVHIIEIWAPWKNRLELYTLKTGINGKDAKVNLNKLDKLKEDVGLKDVLSHVDVRVRNNCCLQKFLREGTEEARKLLQGK